MSTINSKECAQCVMDESDPLIVFDENGVCNHCRQAIRDRELRYLSTKEQESILSNKIKTIKETGRDNAYDCIIGLSGGLDSIYLAVKLKEWGLRPLVIHVDTGWNSELSVHNIENALKYCEFDLHTHVVNWETMRDLQLAYLKSSISNQDVPQDHIIFSTIYHYAVANNIRFILTGGNSASESILPQSWHGSALDSINLRDIHKKFGTLDLKDYETISFSQYYFWYPFIKKIKVERLLDYIVYDKSKALEELTGKIGYKSYQRKHGESNFTKLFQNYYLPKKFKIDKRRAHLSSLIVSGQISKSDAIKLLNEPLYNQQELENDITYFCKKMRLSRDDLNDFLKLPNRHYTEFKNWDKKHRILKTLQRFLSDIFGLKLNRYS